MVAQLDRTKFHKVFPVEQAGRTLIVTPKGDAVSFRDSDVAQELNTLMEVLEHFGPVSLLVDLSGHDYYGSTMIGAIHNLGTKVQESGGQMVLCGASNQMLDVLRIMHLDSLWMNFDSRKIALKAMNKA